MHIAACPFVQQHGGSRETFPAAILPNAADFSDIPGYMPEKREKITAFTLSFIIAGKREKRNEPPLLIPNGRTEEAFMRFWMRFISTFSAGGKTEE